MINQLNADQLKAIPEYVRKFTEIGLSTQDSLPPKEVLLPLVAAVYKEAGLLAPTTLVYLDSPLHGTLGSYLLSQVQNQVRDQVRDQVWNQVGTQVRDQVRDQVWDQVGTQVRDQVGTQVENQVWDQVGTQVRDQIGNQVWNQVWNQVRDQVWNQIWNQVRDQVWNQIGDQIENQIWNQVWDQVGTQVREQMYRAGYGGGDMSWLSFYMYFLNECNITACSRLLPLTQLSTQVGWWWPHEDVVIITPKPSKIHMNAHGRLHRELGPALSYGSSLHIYALNGVRFEGDITKYVTTPASQLNPSEILSIKNVEQRAEVIKRVGIEKFIQYLNPRILDKVGTYELLSVSLRESGDRVYLRMQNPSVDEVHIEAVPPECRTVDQARQWRNFGTLDMSTGKFIEPLVLT